MKFYVGCHQPSDAQHFEHASISINRLRERKSAFAVRHWVLNSGAFSEIKDHGRYRHTVAEYARDAARWIGNGELDAIVAQDYMCEPFMVKRTGLSVVMHQRLTIKRYDELLTEALPVYVLPVLQGYSAVDYLHHLRAYGDRLPDSAWVGVGSVCKIQSSPDAIVDRLSAIKWERPDLRLHGFGVKITALADVRVRQLLYSADSMAWSRAARWRGRNGNDWREGEQFRARIDGQSPGGQMVLAP